MPPDVGGERTEPATPKRREEVRKKGQLARTAELGPALMILAAYLVFTAYGPALADAAIRMMRHGLTAAETRTLTPRTLEALAVANVLSMGRILAPVLLAAACASLTAQLVQVGFLWSTEALRPDWNRVNPVEGFERLFSRRVLVDLVRSLLKVAVIAWQARSVIEETLLVAPALTEGSLAQAAAGGGALVGRLFARVGAVFLAVSAADYIYQRWDHERSIRMTRKELEEELRLSEGDPQVRSRQRQRQRQIALGSMLKAVEQADVVVTNPVHVAVALRYEAEKMSAPVIVARGAGETAERIKRVAREHRVPIVRNEALARGLFSRGNVGQEVPPELYQAVAELLAFVYRLRGRQAN
ncbi:MAG: flagellar biosynthesis protein FlhB [Limnochordia bacterium]|jgi:flagellar biosynthetic protein FlhB